MLLRNIKACEVSSFNAIAWCDTGDRSEIIYSNLRNGEWVGIEKQFLVEAMILRSHKARELGA